MFDSIVAGIVGASLLYVAYLFWHAMGYDDLWYKGQQYSSKEHADANRDPEPLD